MARLLLVDDDTSVLKGLARTLSRGGYDVVAVTSPGAALESEGRFDVAVMDIDLQTDIDGVGCAQRLLDRGRIGEVIFHSATGDPKTREAARFLGSFVAKGEIDELRALLPTADKRAAG